MFPKSITLALALSAISLSATAQTASPDASGASPSAGAGPVTSVELSACKASALAKLSAQDATIKDIFFDEDGMVFATADVKVEDTAVRHILMGEAYLQTDRRDKPRRFLCLIGEDGKVLLTFFTSR
jgi:hypothetical protein